jgi:hypothetical protein
MCVVTVLSGDLNVGFGDTNPENDIWLVSSASINARATNPFFKALSRSCVFSLFGHFHKVCGRIMEILS